MSNNMEAPLLVVQDGIMDRQTNGWTGVMKTEVAISWQSHERLSDSAQYRVFVKCATFIYSNPFVNSNFPQKVNIPKPYKSLGFGKSTRQR